MKMSFVHTSGSAWYSGMIKWASGGDFNHSLVAFTLANGDKVYFESLWKKDAGTKKTGVRGPIAWQDLEDWVAKHPKHTYAEQELPYHDEVCQAAFKYCSDMVPLITYPHRQLLSNLKTMMLGRGMAMSRITPNEWTCSETVARVWAHIDPKAVLRYLNIGNLLFDMIAPSGAKFGLKEAVDQFISDDRIWRNIIGATAETDREDQ